MTTFATTAALAAALRAVADDLDRQGCTDLPADVNFLNVGMQVSDQNQSAEARIATVDTLTQILLGKPGERRSQDEGWTHTNPFAGNHPGGVYLSIYTGTGGIPAPDDEQETPQ